MACAPVALWQLTLCVLEPRIDFFVSSLPVVVFFFNCGGCRTLTKLDFSSNNITDFTGKMEGMARMAAALEINTGLQDLNLSDNCVGEIGAQLLDHCIVKNTSLTCLELGMNRLGPVGGKWY